MLGSLAARFRRSWEWRRAYIAGLACMAVDLLLCALIPSLWLLLPVFVLGGFGNGFALVHDRLLLGAAVPDALHGRVYALQKALTSLAFAASFIGASVLISAGGVQMTFAIAGAGMLGVIAISSPRMRAAWPAPTAPPRPSPCGSILTSTTLENADDPAFDLGYWESVVRDVAPAPDARARLRHGSPDAPARPARRGRGARGARLQRPVHRAAARAAGRRSRRRCETRCASSRATCGRRRSTAGSTSSPCRSTRWRI